MAGRWPIAAVVAMLWTSHAQAQPVAVAQDTAAIDNELSKEAENPVTLHVTIPLRYEGDFYDGPYGATKNTYSLDQAVLPFLLNDDWALITRTKFPAYSEPPKKIGDSWQAGLGNGYTTFFVSPAHGEGIYWGVGPVLYYPSATNSNLGQNKWGTGPSVAILKKDKSPWEYGAVVNNIWTLAGPPGSSNRYNQMLINPFISFHFGDGWSVGTSPNITANWLARAGQVWTLPVGGGVGKLFRIGSQPMQFSVDVYYNAIRPAAGSETWAIQATVTLVFARE
jgi:hypothetical protein